jgi:plasmid maintenance system antidote protein VapI
VRVSALASQFGVRRQTITNICQGRTWNNVR